MKHSEPSTPTTNNETKPRDPAAIFLDSPHHGMTTEQRQAFRDIEALAAYFRTAAPSFEAAAGGETRQSVKKQGAP